jgi:membrane-bound lytic murein transglycosylase B
MKFHVTLLLLMLFSATSQALELAGISEFIDEMVAKHQFDHAELTTAFEQTVRRPETLAAMSRPSTSKPWLEYRAAFVNAKRTDGGLKFWDEHATTLQRASQQYGVPPEIIVALIGIETGYGRNAGKFRVMDALTTLAFDYPARGDFFRGELEQFLLLAREQHFDYLAIKSSYAGALGIPQFMPSSYRKYAVDFNGNGKVDILNEAEDAIGSVANYLQGYGWQTGAPIAARASIENADTVPQDKVARSLAEWKVLGVIPAQADRDFPSATLLDFTVENGKEYWLMFENFQVIRRYNNSNFYSMTVFELADALRQAHP